MIYELLLFLFCISIIPLAFEDLNKYTLSPEYMILPIILGFFTALNSSINFTYFNVFITLLFIILILFLGLSGLWGMGDSYFCLVIMIPFSTLNFLFILIVSSILSLLFHYSEIKKGKKVKIRFGYYLTCGSLFLSNYLLLKTL